ncbi:S41 family peptidase [Chitinophaga nivalis]|uniref:S41 family peptidase n=1 Tax=Chitinophaga nivalis TaxID=2991709 RepID=A0ABT3IJP0_9BACT|nr:S41 family peptidase [Chitinophaga nivalis]MCW3466123.1 S41 family peptidase [Chitinophaga nivalis]MCW3484186.1 S41 family peptidase [Chitinophaga nivalis]
MYKTLFAFFLCLTTYACRAQSSLYNLNFEQVDPSTGYPLHWGLGSITGTINPVEAGAFRIDSTVSHQGRNALLIDRKGTGWVACSYKISRVFAGKKIQLKGYLKTALEKGQAAIWMRIDGREGNPIAFNNMEDRMVTGTTAWEEYTITLNYEPEIAADILVGVLFIGEGKVWADDLRVTIDDKDISTAAVYPTVVPPAALDTAFDKGSGITAIPIAKKDMTNLVNLGQLWGFLKYYHAGVNRGEYNMDAALFRVLPQIINAGSKTTADSVLEKWVDGFGKPAPCPSCQSVTTAKNATQLPVFGQLFETGNFPASLREKLIYIRDNRDTATLHYYITHNRYIHNPEFRNEKKYREAGTYPDAGMRLLSLYRFWNMIRYFFPARHLITKDWDGVLQTAIPEFCQATDSTEYVKACLKLIGQVEDTHANIWPGNKTLDKAKGEWMTPFKARFIEDKLVVTSYYKDTLAIRESIYIGDVIEAIDGTPVQQLVQRYQPLTPASNRERMLRDVANSTGWLLRGQLPQVRVKIRRNGKTAEVLIPRIRLAPFMWQGDGNERKVAVGYKLLPDNIGYLYPANLKDPDLDKVKKLLGNTRGIIIDLRCYPGTFMPHTYGEWFKQKVTPFVQFTYGSADRPGMFFKGEYDKNGGAGEDHYKGKLVVIVDENTLSQAEYTTMAFASCATVIGTTTAGADGNISFITLPGDVRTMISGIGILYPDGTEAQRKGVKIDRIVKPTIAGIKAGRDEQLEAAIQLIEGK